MSLILMLSVQAAAVAIPAAPAPPPAPATSGPRWAMPAMTGADGTPTALAFDLASYRGEGGSCSGIGAAEILVCGPRRRGGGDYPLAQWARIFAARPIRAEMDLGGGAQGRIYSEAVPMDRGAVSNRVLIGVRMPF